MKKIHYGIDAPVVIRNMALIGIVLILIFIFLPGNAFPPVSAFIKWPCLFTGISLLVSAAFMILYSTFGKYHQRNRILALHQWKGDERVLDVGTGLGLLVIGAAKKLTTGTSYGIDIFNSYDLSGNTMEQLKANIDGENVGDKVNITNANIMEAPFENNYFDVIVSNLCLHNLYKPEERYKACNEIFRILKPGAEAIISDFKNTSEYKKAFQKIGMKTSTKGPYFLDTFPPLTIIVAQKPY